MAWGDIIPPEQMKTGGSMVSPFVGTTGRSFTNNNPLNLEYRPGSYQDQYGAELEPVSRSGKQRFAKFPTMEAGYNAGLDQIRIDQQRGHTLASFVNKFAPPHENPTNEIIASYAKQLGVKPDTPLSEIDPEQLIIPMLAWESSTKILGADKIAAKTPGGGWGKPISPEQMAQWGAPVEDPQIKTKPQPQPAGLEQSPLLAAPEAGLVNTPEGTGKELARVAMPAVRPALEMGGLAGGAILGSAAAPGVGTVAGAGLGYGIGRQAANVLESAVGIKEAPPIGQAVTEAGKDVATGAMMEMGGQVGGKALQKGLEGAGAILRPALGKMSGTGTGAVEEALKGSKDFMRALRGEMSGDEVVENAHNALQLIKNERAAAYQSKLANIEKINQELDTTPLNRKVADLMKQFGAKVDIGPKGELKFDTSRIAMGKKGRNDIEEILETMSQWGSKPGDKTPLGLDTLKRQLDDFYSDSSQARAFVANLRKSVKDLIVKNVPEYAEMTKGYAETTKIIKDIESGLMMRPSGIQGRIVADQTLRRLVSSMKDNFELRRELVDILGGQSGQDIAGQVAGHAMSALWPRGLAGLATITEGGLAWAKFVNPKIWPFIIASSPRVQGEFLQVFGKALKETKGMSMPVAKMTAYLSLMQQEAQKDNQNPVKKQVDALIQKGDREGAVSLLKDAASKGKVGVERAVEWLGETTPTTNQ